MTEIKSRLDNALNDNLESTADKVNSWKEHKEKSEGDYIFFYAVGFILAAILGYNLGVATLDIGGSESRFFIAEALETLTFWIGFIMFTMMFALMAKKIVDNIRYRNFTIPSCDEIEANEYSLDSYSRYIQDFSDGKFNAGMKVLKRLNNPIVFNRSVDTSEMRLAMAWVLSELGGPDDAYKIATYMKSLDDDNAYYFALRNAEKKGSLAAAKEIALLTHPRRSSSGSSWFMAGLALGIIMD